MNVSPVQYKQQERSNNELSDHKFIEQFESLTLDKQFFDHIGHMRLTWLYLNQYDLEKSILLVNKNIKAYAESLGAKDKFHFTITTALVRIIDKRLILSQSFSWNKFLTNNYDLVDDAISVLLQYYTSELLFSDAARASFIEPDVKSI